MRVLTDFHHSSLLLATNMLFGDRLGMEVYRPIGMEWFEEAFWGINNLRDTAAQFLSLDQTYKPGDGTPSLNQIAQKTQHIEGICQVMDPGAISLHKACTLDYFKDNQWDYVIASIPAHVPLFEKLIKLYSPSAKLIVQVGNNWSLDMFQGRNILASVKPSLAPATVHFYRQEFSRKIFSPEPAKTSRNIYSFVNVIEKSGIGWEDYNALKAILEAQGFNFAAYGGQCPDGNMDGPLRLARKMYEAMMIFHVKPGGDGFGHIIHNAYACGRPIITRSSHYNDCLAEDLLVPGTFIDLDKFSIGEAKNTLTRLAYQDDVLLEMGRKAAQQFDYVVDYDKEAQEVSIWLQNLK